ncbi:hypothetical protein GCM10023221_01990 [Luteimicrobium xylanilyticum]|uniref:Uncharacterized protein n=1 Tax=Luteimicrobium xylanilyticum TaxID=1133546 RepID=A0A5P9QAP5_9MICO|nr:hypothetical protein [Luteimicrobium xylanilyticum]QFU97505.1 hypothetical protein KDY119_01003 [Luteimicrobium xylanilyticum]
MSTGPDDGHPFAARLRLCRAALVLALGCVLTAASWSWDVEVGGGACGTAFRVHPGSGYAVTGGETSDGARRVARDECLQAGAWPWRAGWATLVAGAGGAVALLVVPLLARPRRT